MSAFKFIVSSLLKSSSSNASKNSLIVKNRSLLGAALLSLGLVIAPLSTNISDVQAEELYKIQGRDVNAAEYLKHELTKLNAFSAKFKQELTDSSGEILGEGRGTIYLMRPDRFMMHTVSPDETVLFTKGKDIYFFDIAVNQVSIFSMDRLGSNPMLLLANSESMVWDDYRITKDGDRYTLVPKNNKEVKSLTIAFVPRAQNASVDKPQLLDSLTVRMDDGNTNFYLFTNQQARAVESNFEYDLPADVEVDDQR